MCLTFSLGDQCLCLCLECHSKTHRLIVAAQMATLVGWTLVYVFMQMFAIPGTVSLSLLSGALFGTLRGLCLVAGASSSNPSQFFVTGYHA